MGPDETISIGLAIDDAGVRQVFDDLEGRSRAFGSALTGALTSAARDGKGLEDVLKGLALRISDIGLSVALKPLSNALGGIAGGLFGGLGQASPFANGGVPGRVTAFADGGIVSAPTYFPMGANMGLMGEAGSEAILPLRRGPDGALGVASAGGSAPATIVFNVTATDASSFRKSEGQIAAMLTRSVTRGRRGL